MKRYFAILLLQCMFFAGYSQDHIFILVDVSKSVSQASLQQSKAAIGNILQGIQPTDFTLDGGNTNSLSNCKATQNDRIMIMKFGEKTTIMSYTPVISPIINFPVDLLAHINGYYPQTPTDNWTFITLAKARAAEIAKHNKINNFRIVLISDNKYDDYGGNPNYTQTEKELVDGYNTSSNPVGEGPAEVFKSNSNPDYQIRVQKIDVSGYTPPSNTGNNSKVIPPDTTAKITLVSYAGGKNNREVKVDKENLSINWVCSNCPKGIKYSISVTQYDGGDFREPKKETTSQSLSIKVPDGKFKITVSAQNTSASSDTTYVEVSTGSTGWILPILGLLAAGGVGYYFFNRKRQQKLEDGGSNSSDDIFIAKPTSNTPSSGNNTNTNQGYF